MPRSLFLALVLAVGAASPALSAEKTDPDDVPLAGVVTWASGGPAAEADVWLVTASMRGEPLVYDHAQTDAEGKFRLTLPSRWANQDFTVRQELGVVAWQEGWAPVALCYLRKSTPNAATLRLELKPLARASLRILSPDGRAVRGAKVKPTLLRCDALRTDLTAGQLTADMQAALKATPNGPALGHTMALLPREVSRHLQAESDRNGNVTLSGLALDDIAQLRIETEEFGTQLAQLDIDINDYHSTPKMPDTITLRPVGRIAGRLMTASRDGARGVRIRMTSTASEPPVAGEVAMVGLAEAEADADGRFEAPALAEGALSFFATLPTARPCGPGCRRTKPSESKRRW